jgi:hypothetical protein
MGHVVSIEGWRRTREAVSAGDADGAATEVIDVVGQADPCDDADIDRLERAVGRLDSLVAGTAGGGGRSQADLETELLAIKGALSLGRYRDATARAEELAERLGRHPARRGG